jgi:hypothetical protein
MTGGKYTPGQEIVSGRLYRRVFPDQGNFPRGFDARPSRQAFERNRKTDPGISASLADVVTMDEVLAGHEGFALVALEVETATNAGFKVTFDPTPDDKGHVLISGPFSRQNCKKLSSECEVVRPGNPDLRKTRE